MALQFSVGLDAFLRQDCAGAKSVFQHILADFPEDIPSLLYLERIAEYQIDSPPADWDGVINFSHK